MIARTSAAILSLTVALGSGACVSFYEIGVDVPIQSKIDVSAFRQVLIAGFLSGGSGSIDPNTETARLLRSQLRTKSELTVIDADVLLLVEEFDRRQAGRPGEGPAAAGANGTPVIQTEEDLERYEPIFEDAEFWKSVGEQHDGPLIITGSVLFTEISRSGMSSRPRSYVDPATGREVYEEVREYADMRGYALTPTFVFIDGRTGEQLYAESFHEESLYASTQNTPALSSYFELMDKLLPGFLNTLSTQRIRGSRVLLK
jgi:hypothetical protein